MPYNEPQHRDSWPPTVVRICDDEAVIEETSAIDDNPFAFFLTSPDEIDIPDDDDMEDLSAGIETLSKSPQVREISPSSIQRSPLPLAGNDDNDDDDDDEEIEYGFAMPLSLEEFTARHAEGRRLRRGQRTEDKLEGLGIKIPKFTAKRGRGAVRLTPSRAEGGRGQTRSLSAQRPHSWRVPSPDIGSIKEERESDDGENGQNAPKQTLSISAPSSPDAVKKQMAKPMKRVHWNF